MMFEVGGHHHPAGELHIRKELIALKRARCLRDPATSSSWKSPITGKSVANSDWNYGNGNCERESVEGRNGFEKDASSDILPTSVRGGDISNGERGLLHNWRKSSVTKKSSKGNHQIHASVHALSQLSLEEQDPFNELEICNEDDVRFSRRNRRTGSLDCNSRSGSPLLTRDAWRFRQQSDKDNKRSHCLNLSRDAIRQNEESYTPASTCSYSINGDRNPSVVGSRDGTAFSGNDEMDGLDLPRHGCGIPCYWSRTPKHRSSGGCSFSPSFSDSVRRKVTNMVLNLQTITEEDPSKTPSCQDPLRTPLYFTNGTHNRRFRFRLRRYTKLIWRTHYATRLRHNFKSVLRIFRTSRD